MKCVRCNNEFDNPSHPMSHFSTICQSCKNESPETIHDQGNYCYRSIFEDKRFNLLKTGLEKIADRNGLSFQEILDVYRKIDEKDNK